MRDHPELGRLPPSVVDPKAGRTSGRNVLVVSTVDEVAPAIRRRLDESDTVKVVVPVVGQGLLDWLANDEVAFARAHETAGRIADSLPGETVDAKPGEADVGLAIRDALATFPADEILVAVPADDETVAESLGAESTSAGRALAGVPLRIVATGRT